MLSHFSHARLFVTPWTPLSMEFSRQEQWSGFPFPPPGVFPTQELNLSLLQLLLWQAGSLPLSHPGNPFACLFGSRVLDPSTDTGTWVSEEGRLGLNPRCDVLEGSGHIMTYFGCHR